MRAGSRMILNWASLEFRVGCRARRRTGKPESARLRKQSSWPRAWPGDLQLEFPRPGCNPHEYWPFMLQDLPSLGDQHRATSPVSWQAFSSIAPRPGEFHPLKFQQSLLRNTSYLIVLEEVFRPPVRRRRASCPSSEHAGTAGAAPVRGSALRSSPGLGRCIPRPW